MTATLQSPLVAASCADSHTNLLVKNGCNSLSEEGSSDREGEEERAVGCNSFQIEDLNHSETKNLTQEEGIAHLKKVLEQIRERRQAEKLQKDSQDRGAQLPLPFIDAF